MIAKWTGIPVTPLVQSEMEKLLHLEDDLHQRVIGQNQAVTAVSDAIQRSQSRSERSQPPHRQLPVPPDRPVWAKRSCPKPWPTACSTDDEAMVRIDMSEYMEKHTVSRLIGAPPGYVGYEEGGNSPKRCGAGPTP